MLCRATLLHLWWISKVVTKANVSCSAGSFAIFLVHRNFKHGNDIRLTVDQFPVVILYLILQYHKGQIKVTSPLAYHLVLVVSYDFKISGCITYQNIASRYVGG